MSGTIEYVTRKWLHAHGANTRAELKERYHYAYDLFRADLLADAERYGWT